MSDEARPRRRGLGRGVRMGLLVLSVLLWGAAAAAEPSPNEISWVQTDAEAVARFVVLIGPSEARSSVNTRVIDVGRPAGQAIGGNRTLFRAIVSMEAEESVAVSAVSHEGLASAPSAWLTPVPTQPGQPQVVTP